jgi:hippurate hydrolase
MAKAAAGQLTLPSLHSPFWAPEADKVIATASEATTMMALDILKR